jgi:RNA polymerase sigma factor (sigma-70 family)
VTATGVLDERGDATLIAAVRDGDTDAYGVLFERHVDAARRLARTLAPDGDADDLVAEAFAKVLPMLVRGEGPDLAFRAYLLTAVRRLNVDRHRTLARTRPTDDEAVLDAGQPFSDTAVAGFESAAAARAFASLPERWQLVLWHTEVEGQRPAEVAPLLGLSANAVSQLAHRAREGLRQAFVSMHVQESGDAREACQTTRANLGAYIRAGLSGRESSRVSAHLECCRPCTAIYLELLEVDHDLRGLLAPLLLGCSAAAYLSDVPVSVAPTALASIGGFLKTGPVKVLAGTAAAGLTVTALVLGGGALIGTAPDRSTDRNTVAEAPAQLPPPASLPAGKPGKPAQSSAPSSSGGPSSSSAGSSGSPQPSSQPTHHPSSQPSQEPSHEPSQGPTHQPTHNPTPGPTNGPTSDPTPDSISDPSAVDMRITASKTGIGPAAVVVVNVAGLAPGQAGTVTVAADQLAASLNLDPRCDLVGINTATCRVVGDGSLQMLAAGLGLLSPTTLTITLAPGQGLHDPAMGDNTTHVTLG